MGLIYDYYLGFFATSGSEKEKDSTEDVPGESGFTVDTVLQLCL